MRDDIEATVDLDPRHGAGWGHVAHAAQQAVADAARDVAARRREADVLRPQADQRLRDAARADGLDRAAARRFEYEQAVG